MIKRLLSVAIGISSMTAVLVGVGGCAAKEMAGPATPRLLEPAAGERVQKIWVADLSLQNDHLESVYPRQNTIYVYTENNDVYAISRFGGKINWETRIGEPFTALLPPLVTADRVVFPVNTTLHIYDNHGIEDHAQDVGFAMHAPGVTDGGHMIYIPEAHEGGARVAAIDINKQVGEVVWEFLTRGPITAAPALYENLLFVGSEDNRVYAVTTSRLPVWSLDDFAFETAGRIEADVKADDYAVYAASTDTKLYALDRLSGKIKWMYYGEAPLSTPPAVTADMVYQYAPGKGLVAINKTAGKMDREAVWAAPQAKQVLSVGAKRVYVSMDDGTIGALDKENGKVVWRGSRKYSVFTTNLQDSTIFVATDDGQIYAYRPDGEAPATRPTMQPKATTSPKAMPGTTMSPAMSGTPAVKAAP